MADLKSLIKGMATSAGASDAMISDAERELGVKLPSKYVEFLKLSNGAEGFVGEGYARLWPVQELAVNNREYGVAEMAPGCVAFGSNGGGEGFGFDTRDGRFRIVQLPWIGMEWDVVWEMGEDFEEFLKRLAEGAGGSELV